MLQIEESSNGMAGWQLREGLKNSMEKIRKKHQKKTAQMAGKQACLKKQRSKYGTYRIMAVPYCW